MLVIKDKKKVELIFAIIFFILMAFLFDFFLARTKTNGVWEWFFSSVVFFLVTPLVLVKFLLKEKIQDQYLNFHFKTKGLLLSFAAIFLYLVAMWTFVVYFDWKQYMAVSSWALGGTGFLLFVDLVLAPAVLFSKEFFFRSYLMGAAVPVFGAFGALVLQALLATFFDWYLSGFVFAWQRAVLFFVLYFFLGILAWLNRSVFVSFIFVWVHTIAVDLFFIYQIANNVG